MFQPPLTSKLYNKIRTTIKSKNYNVRINISLWVKLKIEKETNKMKFK